MFANVRSSRDLCHSHARAHSQAACGIEFDALEVGYPVEANDGVRVMELCRAFLHLDDDVSTAGDGPAELAEFMQEGSRFRKRPGGVVVKGAQGTSLVR